jgi:hypothetical protein
LRFQQPRAEPDGTQRTGDIPGVRTKQRGALVIACLSDVRAEGIVVVQVTWLG